MLRVWIQLRRGVLDTTLCDKVYQWLATGRWFSPGTPVSSTNKTDRHDITEILLKVALTIINLITIRDNINVWLPHYFCLICFKTFCISYVFWLLITVSYEKHLKMEWQIPFLEFLSSMFNKIHCGLVWPCSTNNSNHNLLHSSKRNLANNSHVKNKTGENDPFVSKWYIELSVVFNTR
jgi:hypothetical protein